MERHPNRGEGTVAVRKVKDCSRKEESSFSGPTVWSDNG